MFSNLKDDEVERLAILVEEAGEVIQAATKILRHGYRSCNPDVPVEVQVSNRYELEKEIGHVLAAISLMDKCADLSYERINAHAKRKAAMIGQYLHHNLPVEPHEVCAIRLPKRTVVAPPVQAERQGEGGGG